MAETVFREVYEIIGDGVKIAEDFNHKRSEAWDAQWRLVKSLGGSGFRPGHGGGIRSVFFDSKTAPDGFRKIGREGGKIECVPSRNIKLGKENARKLAQAPVIEEYRVLADAFGWAQREWIIGSEGGRSKIYWPSGVRVSKPSIRTFLTFPRKLNDDWTPPPTLKEVRESDMLRAIEEHNAAVKKIEEAA